MKKLKAKNDDNRMLTEVELELMTILWRLGEGSVADVMDGLPSGRDLAYTSVSTILRILEQKGVLKSRKEGRGHVYIPEISKAAYEVKTIHHVVDRVFEGTPMALVKQLLGNVKLDEKSLQELRGLVDKMGSKK